jgi:N6-adenosine-specific RNA methylase IME4
MTIRVPHTQARLAYDPAETVEQAGGYRCIVADPPWNEKGGSRGADKKYELMKTPDILRTMLQAQCWRPAENAHLWLWVTSNFLEDGLFILRGLGFRYVSSAIWVKPSIGIGQYLRLRHELILFGVRGRLHTQDLGVDSVIEAPRREHSAKPDESYQRIERVSPGPRLEMFSRRDRPGWDVWGFETGKLNAEPDLVDEARGL